MENRWDTSLQKQQRLGLIIHMEELDFEEVKHFHHFSENAEIKYGGSCRLIYKFDDGEINESHLMLKSF